MDGKYLRAARDRAEGKPSQAKLAEVMGVAISQVSRYESGKKSPPVDQLERAAKFLRVPLMSLIGPHTETAAGPPQRDKDDLFRILTLVLSALLESWGVSPERIRGFVASLIAAYETPEALGPGIPSDQQIRFLSRSLSLELEDQQQTVLNRKTTQIQNR